ncbi:MAG TPA: GNAT family N-acetyltransferase [Luteimonas sp.]|nr:GNAT family N-acetyltransferase [Luteimonas sp.]
MSAYRIRAAEPADAALLSRWAQAMAMETEHRRLDASIVDAGVAAGIADASKARYFIAMQDAPVAGRETIGSAIGTLMLTREWSDWRNGDWWWIQSVYVDPAHRRQGVFAALYRHVERLARATPGVIGLRLYVERDNIRAQSTYASLGMVDAGYRIFEAGFA